jgi:hypothetical protein
MKVSIYCLAYRFLSCMLLYTSKASGKASPRLPQKVFMIFRICGQSKKVKYKTLKIEKYPLEGLLPLHGRGSKSAGCPLVRVFAAVEPPASGFTAPIRPRQ